MNQINPNNQAQQARDERIKEKLQVLKPTHLVLKNTSHKHAAHIQRMTEVTDSGDTHYTLEIASHEFQGKSRIDRQRLIHDLLKDEFASGMHALEIKIKE